MLIHKKRPVKNNLNGSLTPIERLLANKYDVEAKCIMQEKKLQDDYKYIQNNASSLFLSGLSSLLFSSGQTKKKPETQSVALIDKKQSTQNDDLFSLSNVAAITQNMIPFLWGIVQPLLIKWSIEKVKSWLIGLFTKKKKHPANNQCKSIPLEASY